MIEGGTQLDTTKLVVGQDVTMASGVYGQWGTVVKVTPEAVEVRVKDYRRTTGELLIPGGQIQHFNAYGYGYEGTFECGPWIIVDICPHVLGPDGYHCQRCCYEMVPWEVK